MNGSLPIAFFNFWADANFHNDYPIPNRTFEELDVTNISMLQRRRLSLLDKIYLHLLNQLPNLKQHNTPIIGGSRFGEMHRTINLISQIKNNDLLSPTDFSHSVLNTPIALHSIINKNPQNHLSISAGENTLISALIEADTYYKENNSKDLILIIADEELPKPYKKNKKDGSAYSYGILFYISNTDTLLNLNWSKQCKNEKNDEFLFYEFLKGFLNELESFNITAFQQKILFYKNKYAQTV